ncbi:MAG: helicase-related protein [Brevinematia bacterium]
MFITNEKGKDLGSRIRELVTNSKELKFLVGFFYFSGLREIYESLRYLDSNGKLGREFIKVLVGLNVDDGVNGIYEYSSNLKEYNQIESKEEFLNSLRAAFNSSDLDKREIYEQTEFFLRLLQEGKLVIRKTKQSNHSKLYIFKLQDEISKVIPHLFITGSSNFTRAGLRSQEEFNVEIKDYGVEDAEKYFDELWEKSIEFDPEDVVKIVRILKRDTLLREITPFEAWAYILKIYLDLHAGVDIEKKDYVKYIFDKASYVPYNYQLEAVLQAIKMCETHRGVILADVVGLGKTVIASTLAKALGKRGIVICPPHLIGDESKTYGWKKYLEDFGLYDWEVWSIGKLREVLDFVRNHRDIEVVIVDEAHRFRNENTERYHLLHEICRGKIVVLLSATPFNNRPSDIFALLKLFTIPKKSTIILDEDLENRFNYYEGLFKKLSYIKNYYNSEDKKKRERAVGYYKEIFGNNLVSLYEVQKKARELAKDIRGILEPVVIRRNRLDLKYYGEELAISKVKDPEECFFELTKEQSEFYDEVINTFADAEEGGGKFKGAVYFPIKYERDLISEEEVEKLPKEESFMFVFQRNLYDFMRRLLVKRFESSFGAFRESIRYFINVHEYAIEFVERTGKFVLNRDLLKRILDTDDEEEVSNLLEKYEEELKGGEINKKYHRIYEISKMKYAKRFQEDLKKDLELFKNMLRKFEDLKLADNDPKVRRLISKIKEIIPHRKVVIFTEYSDTARYLKGVLENHFADELLTAYGDLSKSTIQAIYKNFDAQYKEQEDKYKILLATDKISEGFNLNRAGAVINYDIPWNPVRVIQRVGRINRIGRKVYDEVYIINFFPTEQGADVVKSREISSTKMFMIHKVLGEDSKIFSPDEEPQPSSLYRKLTEYKEEEEESFFTKVRKDFDMIKKEFPEIEERIRNMPFRIKVAKKGDNDELFVFIKKRNDLFIGYKDYREKSPKLVTFDEIYEKVKVKDRETPGLSLSQNFWENYYQIVEEKGFQKLYLKKGTDTSLKAINLLKSMQKEKELKDYIGFISDLIDDIVSYGTLSEYILSEIVNWENDWKKYLDRKDLSSLNKIFDKIKTLEKEIGKDFLERSQKYFKDRDEVVVIAMENRSDV